MCEENTNNVFDAAAAPPERGVREREKATAIALTWAGNEYAAETFYRTTNFNCFHIVIQ